MDILMWAGVITFIVGEAAAFTSKDLYRLWGFSSIGMFGLMLAAFSLGGRWGIYAAVLIMVGHLISKPVLFSLTGALKHKDKDLPLSALDGLMGRSRITALLFIGAALMLLGMPPSPIFWGKFFLFRQVGTGSEWLLMGLLVIGMVLEAGYIGKILWRIMPKDRMSKPFKLPVTTLVMAVIAVALGIILGAAPVLLEDILDLIWIEFLDPVFLSGGVI
jgi:formate hydrogenlyase subunit 3/multisubunit Na+/H+ antiporter MnhD subunit